MHSSKNRTQGGFTLLELLVVVAILATLAGVAIVAYDGLESKSAKGQAVYNIREIDQAVRTFKVTSGSFPTALDAMVTNDGTSTNPDLAIGDVDFYAGLNAKLSGGSDPKLQKHALTAAEVSALSAVGITSAYFINDATNTVGNIPNRDHDAPSRGKGVLRSIAASTVVAKVAAKRLKDIAAYSGLTTSADVVVALGLGNNATIVKAGGFGQSGLSEAPFYTDVAKTEYGRYLVLFVVTRDLNGDGTIDTAAGEGTLSKAQFVGVIDSKGDWFDEEYAEFTGQKL